MTFDFTTSLEFDFITDFSKKFDLKIQDGYLSFPPFLGQGYIRKVVFEKDFRLLLHSYKLKEDLIIKRNPSIEPNDLISIFFYNNKQPLDLEYNKEQPIQFSGKNESAIQITTNDLSSLIHFPANTETQYLVVGITASKLKALLKVQNPNKVLQRITSPAVSFIYFENMMQEILQIIKHILAINWADDLSRFLAQIKVQELLYHLFHQLSKRENIAQKTINNADVERLFQVRSIILEEISKPPLIPKLATTVGMSETKLKQLFKQTFGDSIYNYYQKARMEEAAFLLKQGGYSVSEIGYHLGFSNLSHFSRLFQRYFGITPKKYTSTV